MAFAQLTYRESLRDIETWARWAANFTTATTTFCQMPNAKCQLLIAAICYLPIAIC